MNPALSIVIPSFNEAARLPHTLQRIAEWIRATSRTDTEVIVVDDGSTDGTAAVAEAAPGVRVLRNPGNHGKGYAVREGMLAARGDRILYTDADLSAPIEEFSKLELALESGADVAIGSRALDRSLIGVHQPGFREEAGKVFNRVMRLLTGLSLADTQCGFKLFRREAASAVCSRQKLERFGFDVELLFIASRLGYRIAEVPVRWNHVDGSKVGMLNGLRAFAEIAEVRWNAVRGLYK